MFEGRELDKKFDGDKGEYYVDIDASGMISVGLSYKKDVGNGLKLATDDSVQADLIALLRLLEPKVNSPVLTGAIEAIAKALGR